MTTPPLPPGLRFLDDTAFASLAAPFVEHGVLELVDVHAVDLIAGAFGRPSPQVQLALALAIRAPRHGHVGVELHSVAGSIVVETPADTDGDAPERVDFPWPENPARWFDDTCACGLVQVIDEAGGTPDRRPFVMHEKILIAERWWRHQLALRNRLLERAGLEEALVTPRPGEPGRPIDVALLRKGLDKLFGASADPEQRLAAMIAVLRPLSVISGGPGTGKTTTVRKVLALLFAQWQAAHGASDSTDFTGIAPLVALAAPTGKAATRMEEAIREGVDALHKDAGKAACEWLKSLRPSTLHRLLNQVRPGRSGASHLPHDIVLVDEASMIDLALMRRLVEAVRPDARLILLGDRDQLASVAAGTVLADLTRDAGPSGMRFGSRMAKRLREIAPSVELAGKAAEQAPALADGVVQLLTSHRAEADSGVWAVMDAIARAQRITSSEPEPTRARDKLLDRATLLLTATSSEEREGFRDLTFFPHDVRKEQGAARETAGVSANAAKEMIDGWLPLVRAARTGECDHVALLAMLEDFRVLAAHRRGALGVEGLNDLIGRAIASKLLGGDAASETPDDWMRAPALRHDFVGRPVIVTENRYDVQRMNGDVGIVVAPAPGRRTARVAFPGREGTAVEYLDLPAMPPHETVFAMTIHKSQGSQFKHTMIVLPARTSRILTRELVYTAVTRSRKHVSLAGTREVLREALGRTVQRASTLGSLLWGS